MFFRDDAARFLPLCEQEAAEQKLMLQWIDRFPDTILYRSNAFAHMTASAMIFDPDFRHVLMVYHNIYHSWAWTGGHADGEADLLQTAWREAREESGLQTLTPLSAQPTGLDILPVTGHYKKGVWIPAHLHLSLCYSFTADPSQPLRSKPDENSGVQWLPADRLADYVSEPDMLPVYDRIIRRTLR